MTFSLRAVICLAAFVGAVMPSFGQTVPPEGNKTEFALHRKEVDKQIAEAEKSAKSDGGRCTECHRKLQQLCQEWALSRIETKDAREWIKAASAEGSVEQVIEAKNVLGQALLSELDGAPGLDKKPKDAVEAEHIYAELLAAYPSNMEYRFRHGQALAFLGRNSEAAAEFKIYAASNTPDEMKNRLAVRFMESPSLAAHRLRPALQFETSTGKVFNLSSMLGKVVVLDFWASWCGPCVESLPVMQKMLFPYRGHPYVIVSISIDTDRQKWLDAVKKHGMTWPQALDEDWRIKSLFDVNTVPHFVLMDADGLVVFEGAEIEKMAVPLKDAMAAADRAVARVTTAGN